LHLTDLGDAELAALYAASAFCVFPSHYEGFGLPIIEAYAYSKAVIASTAGALPEVVNGLSPCIDPNDERAWHAAISKWIEEPAAREACEARIKGHFVWPDWTKAAAEIFAAAEAPREPEATVSPCQRMPPANYERRRVRGLLCAGFQSSGSTWMFNL